MGIVIFIGQTLIRLVEIFRILLVIYYLMSWLPDARESTLGEILTKICEPYVSFFRQFIPPIGMFSVASLVAYLALHLIERGIIVIFNFLIRMMMGI